MSVSSRIAAPDWVRLGCSRRSKCQLVFTDSTSAFQFSPFMKPCGAAGPEMPHDIWHQLGHRGKGAGADVIDAGGGMPLDPIGLHAAIRKLEFADAGAQERGFPGVRVEKRHREVGSADRHDYPRKTAAGADVEPGSCGRCKIRKLRAVDDVAVPQVIQGRRRHKVDRRVPPLDQVGVTAQLCFT